MPVDRLEHGLTFGESCSDGMGLAWIEDLDDQAKGFEDNKKEVWLRVVLCQSEKRSSSAKRPNEKSKERKWRAQQNISRNMCGGS